MFTYAFPCHYSQHKLNKDLFDPINKEHVMFGTSYLSHKPHESGVAVTTDSKYIIDCKMIVGTDGVKSLVR